MSADDPTAPEALHLTPLGPADGEELVAAVRASIDHLRPWMTWAHAEYGPDDLAVYLDLIERDVETPFGLRPGHRGAPLVGMVALNRPDPQNRTANVGYWLRADATGRGRVTRAVAALLVHGFTARELERVEVLASVANTASWAVPARLGLDDEGVRPRALRLDDVQHDVRVHAAFPHHLAALRRAAVGVTLHTDQARTSAG